MVVRELLTILGFDVDDKALDKYNRGFRLAIKTATVAGAAIAGVTGLVIKQAGEMEQTQIAFETMLQSTEKAANLIREIIQFAAKTPFEVTGLVASSKQLLAYGIEAEKIIPTMTNLGNIAAGIGKDKLPNIVYAFGKIRTKGRATMEELNILLEAGVPILDELARMYNVSTAELFKMITMGKVTFKDVDQALYNMSNGTGKFANLMAKQSTSFLGIFSNIKDSITNLAISIGQDLLPTAKALGTQFLTWLDINRDVIKAKAVEFLKKLGAAIQNVYNLVNALLTLFGGPGGLVSVMKALLNIMTPLVTAFIAYKVALGITALLTALKKGTLAAALAQKLLNLTMSLSPIGWLMVGLSALIAVIVLLVKNWDTVSAWLKKVWTGFVSWARNLWIGFAMFFSTLWAGITAFFERVFLGLRKLFANKFVQALLAILIPFIGVPNAIIQNWDVLKVFFAKLWDDITIGIKKAKDAITAFFENPLVQKIFGGLKTILGIKSPPAPSQGTVPPAGLLTPQQGGSINVNSTAEITLQVPDGTPQQQQEYLRNQAMDAVNQALQEQAQTIYVNSGGR